MNLVKDDLSSIIEYGALIGGLGMLCFIGWYGYNLNANKETKKENNAPIYHAVTPQKIQSKERTTSYAAQYIRQKD